MRSVLVILALAAVVVLLAPSGAVAQPVAQSVAQSNVDAIFKSVNGPPRDPVDSNYMLAFVLSLGGLLVLLSLLAHRINARPETRVARTVRAVTHSHRKLLREVLKAAPLKRREVKQLQILAEGEGIKSPLTLILSPSTLARAMKRRPEHVDLRVMNGLARKVAKGRRAVSEPRKQTSPST